MRSIARRLAVVASQPPGFSGTPSRGQVAAAAANASWSASSARSKSPTWRISSASTEPWCSRNARSTSVTRPGGPPARRPGGPRSTRTRRSAAAAPSRSPRRGRRSRAGSSPPRISFVVANGPSRSSSWSSRTRMRRRRDGVVQRRVGDEHAGLAQPLGHRVPARHQRPALALCRLVAWFVVEQGHVLGHRVSLCSRLLLDDAARQRGLDSAGPNRHACGVIRAWPSPTASSCRPASAARCPRGPVEAYAALAAIAQTAERSGFETAWVLDHLQAIPQSPTPVFECWALVTALLARDDHAAGRQPGDRRGLPASGPAGEDRRHRRRRSPAGA